MIMDCRQGPVVELLTRWKAEINPDKAAGDLCNAASMSAPLPKSYSCRIIKRYLELTCHILIRGDIEKLKKLIDNKVDPNQGDYDQRTAMHVV